MGMTGSYNGTLAEDGGLVKVERVSTTYPLLGEVCIFFGHHRHITDLNVYLTHEQAEALVRALEVVLSGQELQVTMRHEAG